MRVTLPPETFHPVIVDSENLHNFNHPQKFSSRVFFSTLHLGPIFFQNIRRSLRLHWIFPSISLLEAANGRTALGWRNGRCLECGAWGAFQDSTSSG